MSHELEIRPDGSFDLLSLGGLVIRLDTGLIPFRKAHECTIHVSGAEFNVAANLADCFRLRTAVASAMVDYPVGDLVAERVRAMGVTPFYQWFTHDGVTGPNIATVYSDRGAGVRAPVVFYNRANEAAARLGPGSFDWASIFAHGVRWFHSGGLFAALSGSTSELIVEAVRAARANGAIVSYDLNYREKLWRVRGGQGRAQEVTARILENVDVIVGNEEDLQLSLGLAGRDAGRLSTLDASGFETMVNRVVDAYPNVKVVATSLREVLSTNRHHWSALAWARGQTHRAATMDLDVIDRVGGGDGFASGLFYGILTGLSMEEALAIGCAHGALLTTYQGDTTMATLEQVRTLAGGGSSRIER